MHGIHTSVSKALTFNSLNGNHTKLAQLTIRYGIHVTSTGSHAQLEASKSNDAYTTYAKQSGNLTPITNYLCNLDTHKDSQGVSCKIKFS